MLISLRYLWGEVQEFIFNPDYHQKLLVRSNVLTPVICICYYVLVSYIGPHFMKKRRPFNLKYTIIFYNSFLVVLNIICTLGFTISFSKFHADVLCPEDPKKRFAELIETMKPYTWLYVMLKYVEFLDSVFFLMRKRFDLLSVLHRFHHAILPVASIICLRYSTNLCLFIGMALNAPVHIIMYFYYGLAAAGPRFKKYLWWKKYLTSIQIIQMAANITCVLTNSYTRCYPTRIPEIMFLVICGVFFVLFVNYFIQQWIKTSSKMKEDKEA